MQEYYDIAPTIVKHINRDKKCKEIYASIWEEYLAPCLHLIEEDRKEDCQELYTRMVRNLEKEYFYKNRQTVRFPKRENGLSVSFFHKKLNSGNTVKKTAMSETR